MPRRFYRSRPFGRFRRPLMKSRLLGWRFFRRRFNMRSAMARKRAKPELKYFTNSEIINMAANTAYTYNVTPAAIPQGVSENERIGNRIKFMRVSLHVVCYQNTLLTAQTVPIQRVRFILWTPRIDIATGTSTIENTANEGFFVPNTVATVYMDRTYCLGALMQNADASTTQVNTTTSQIVFRKYVKFPRQVNWSSGVINAINEPKDRMFLTILAYDAGGMNIQTVVRSRTSYIDT